MVNRKISPERARERALFQYQSALERGDFEMVAAVLKQAERDPILWQMIDDLATFDEGAPEARLEKTARAPRNDKHIAQIITVRDPASNGQTPKPDHSQEDTDMMLYTTFESFVPEHPKTLTRFTMRFITLAAAILIVALVGGLLIEMVNDPLDGYPGAVALQTEAPKPCAAETVTDTTAESLRLAEAAIALVKSGTLLKAPVEDRPAMIEQSELLAICALKTAYSVEADTALQRALDRAGLMPALPGHNGDIFEAEFSPDGKFILTSGWDRTARLWDSTTFQEIRQFKQPGLPLTSHFSPDGKFILTSGNNDDLKVRLWETETGKLIYTFPGHALTIFRTAFSPDGQSAVSAAYDGSARLWNLTTGEPGHVFEMPPNNRIVAGIAFSPDGKDIITGSGGEPANGLLQEWDVATGNVVRKFAESPTIGNFWDIKFTPDGRYMLTAGDRGTTLWDYQSGKEVRQLSTTFAYSIALSPDGKLVLISVANSAAAQLVDIETGQILRVFNLRAGTWGGFSPDGRRIVTALNTQAISSVPLPVYVYDADIKDFITYACSKLTRDFTAEERMQYGLGEGAVCP